MTSKTTSTQFAMELDKLRQAYLQRLPEKVSRLQQAWHSLDIENWDPDAYQAVYRLVHNLAGGAGTYGLNNITKEARDLLVTMKPWMGKDEPLESELHLQIDHSLKTLTRTTNNAVMQEEQQTHYLRKPPSSKYSTEIAVSEIFLVEDDVDQANFLKLVLEQAGHRVQTFDKLSDVKVAIQALEPTAILMDMVFPEGELAGSNAIAEIQESRSIPIPVMFISTRADIEARLNAVRAGAWHYFTKPINTDNLLNVLSDYTLQKDDRLSHVLFVDDDPAVSVMYASHLEQTGHITTSILSEPLQLLHKLEEKKPDLILMDYYMPNCNGLELAAVIRQHEKYAKIPIIFLTEETNIETKLTALNIGSDDFFTKSMGPERLVFAVQSRLERLQKLTNQSSDPMIWNSN